MKECGRTYEYGHILGGWINLILLYCQGRYIDSN